MTRAKRMCEQPSVAGDPTRRESWLTLGGCEQTATSEVRAEVIESTPGPFRSRVLQAATVTTYACFAHARRLPLTSGNVTVRRLALRPAGVPGARERALAMSGGASSDAGADGVA